MNKNHARLLFPQGVRKAFTLSYDDGVLQDRRFVEILNKYALKATFNLNSGSFGQQDRLVYANVNVDHSHIEASEVAQLFRNHEVAVHTVTHPDLTKLSNEAIWREVNDDKLALEQLTGYPVRGMAYPGGHFSDDVVNALRETGIEYARTIQHHYSFALPEQFLTWHPTCHDHDPELPTLMQRFLDPSNSELMLFYVWGHSYEFDMEESGWERIEAFCAEISGKPDVWYATNIEIYDYIQAYRNLRFSEDGSMVYNPSACDVYVEINGEVCKITGGATKKLYDVKIC